MGQLAESRTIAGELPLSPNAVVVLKRRYLKKDDNGEVTQEAGGELGAKRLICPKHQLDV